MKKSLLTFPFVLLLFTTNAQKHLIEISGGRTFFGSGDYFGLNLSTNFQTKIRKKVYLYIGLNKSAGMVKDVTEGLGDFKYPFFFYSQNITKLLIGPSFKIRPKKQHSFSVDLLGMARYRASLYSTGYIRNFDPAAPSDFRYFTLPMDYQKVITFGGMAQAGYRFHIKNGFGVGIDGSFSMDQFGDVETGINMVFKKAF